MADRRKRHRTKHLIFPARAVHGTAAPRMPGVDDRAELSAAQVGVVHLIEHERRLPVIDQPEDGGRGDVRGDLRARRQMPVTKPFLLRL